MGVNTRTPTATLDVKATSTTATDRNLLLQDASGQQLVTVLNNGKTGIGTDAPDTKLHLHSATAGALKIVDGTQGAGRFLKSDANGTATWQLLKLFSGTPTIGTFNWAPFTSLGNSGWNKIATLQVKPGANLVFMKIHIYSSAFPGTGYVRTYVSLKDIGANNTNTNDTPLQGSTMFSIYFEKDFELNGSFIYNNTTNTNQTIYLNLQSDTPAIQRVDWTYGTSSTRLLGTTWFENAFYAVPME